MEFYLVVNLKKLGKFRVEEKNLSMKENDVRFKRLSLNAVANSLILNKIYKNLQIK